MGSVDAVVHRLEQQLRKYKEKVQERHRIGRAAARRGKVEAGGGSRVEVSLAIAAGRLRRNRDAMWLSGGFDESIFGKRSQLLKSESRVVDCDVCGRAYDR